MITEEQILKEFRSFAKYEPETGEVLCLQSRQGCPTKPGEYFGVWVKSTLYPKITILGTLFQLSRVIWLDMTGSWPTHGIDHINGNTWDNTWSNLRDVPQKLNNKNKRKQNNNTSGVTGVSYRKDTGKYRAYVKNEGHQITIGTYLTLEDAALAREIYLCNHLELGFTTLHGK
jgi:hypothetical protein